MILYDVDQMTQAIADGVELDEEFYYDAYWMTLNTKGTTVALREDDYVIMYMGIENPASVGFYEQWSCLGQYSEKVGTFHGTVFNYDYSDVLLTNNEVTRNADNIDYQTFYHPNYDRNGPWTMGASSKYYTTYFDDAADVTGMSCTGVRQVGAGQRGYFGYNAGDFINARLGFRVYKDENDTVARLAKDYDMITFELLGAQALIASATALIAAALAI